MKNMHRSALYRIGLRRYLFALLLTTIMRSTFSFQFYYNFSITKKSGRIINDIDVNLHNFVVRKDAKKNQISSTFPIFTFNVPKYSEFSAWNTIEASEAEEGRDKSNCAATTDLLEEHRIWSSAVQNTIKILEKKNDSLTSEQKKAVDIKSIEARAKLLTANIYLFKNGIKSVTVIDWENDGKEVELKLDIEKYESASAEADALFSSVRKLKRGSKRVNELLEETRRSLDNINELKYDLESILDEQSGIDENRLNVIKERLIQTSKSTNFQVPVIDITDNLTKRQRQNSKKNRREMKPDLGTPASNVRKLTSPGGCTVLVGRNRRGNEYLSFSVAKKKDVWMHSRGCPGAHVVIQNRRGANAITDECLQFAANLAIFYSDLRNEQKAEVTAVDPKHLMKPRGAPLGAVKLREEWKTFVGKPNNVPIELKDARQESGQTDDYHMFDKAKHRRKTKQVADEDRVKREKKYKDQKGKH